MIRVGRGSSVGIATGYRLDGPGIVIPVGVRFSAPVQTGPGAHPASCTMDACSFPGVECGRSVMLTTRHLLVSWTRKSRVISLIPLCSVRPAQSLTACTEPHCLHRASLPAQSLTACTEPHCLHRASLPAQSLTACTEPHCLHRASLPVQSLTACTEPQCLHRASLPAQSLTACTEPHCLYKGANFLLPVQSNTFWEISYFPPKKTHFPS